MDESIATIIASVLGVLFTGGLWLADRMFLRRRRLTYRVVSDGPVDLTPSVRDFADLKVTLHLGEEEIPEPSLALLRIRNTGIEALESRHFDHRVRFRFNGRAVVGHAVSEPGEPALADALNGTGDGNDRITVSDDAKELILPRFLFNRGQQFALQVLLSGPSDGSPGVTHRGAVESGAIVRDLTKAGRPSRRMLLYSGLALLTAVATTSVWILFPGKAGTPCVAGEIEIAGSSAFAPVVRTVADAYEKECGKASIEVRGIGSFAGISRLNSDPRQARSRLAMSDDKQAAGTYPTLNPWPVGTTVFVVVVHKSTGVKNLTRQQLQQIYSGAFTNWSEVGGENKSIKLIGRNSQSGTRRIFEQEVLGAEEPPYTSDDCHTKRRAESPVVRCEQVDTKALLEAVDQTEGAIGYAELAGLQGNTDLLNVGYVDLDGYGPDAKYIAQQKYRFWAVAYFYTYGLPEKGTLAEFFIRHMTSEPTRRLLAQKGYSTLCGPTPCV
ncbi:substrate-binding domain-containing protein [Actinocorallia sp. B10E7]|uniref:PstS family phosphate ABC transporter substrate-binding protein n=1 Tax=Actinocorallia sp. B10E7 TaxID=3153558 RepID=UPI00325D8CB9